MFRPRNDDDLKGINRPQAATFALSQKSATCDFCASAAPRQNLPPPFSSTPLPASSYTVGVSNVHARWSPLPTCQMRLPNAYTVLAVALTHEARASTARFMMPSLHCYKASRPAISGELIKRATRDPSAAHKSPGRLEFKGGCLEFSRKVITAIA